MITILIIDDSTKDRDTIKRYLDEYNVNTVEATSLKEGLSMYKLADGIILDDSLTDCEDYASLEQFNSKPMLVVSNTVHKDDCEKIGYHGACGFLAKSTDAAQMKGAIGHMVGSVKREQKRKTDIQASKKSWVTTLNQIKQLRYVEG